MPGRIRNTKQLSLRIDRAYLKKLFPIPLWRRILTAGSLAIALAWIGMYAIARNQTIYSSGPLTAAHVFLGKNCASCHGAKGGIGKKASDAQCATCHDAPAHNTLQVQQPACAECHQEHRGVVRLAAGADQDCVACHGNLRAKGGKIAVASNVSSFADHPEFRAVRDKQSGVGIQFNHAKHVGELGQKCGDCHQAVASTQLHSRTSPRALMKIATYAETCAPCHALTIDDKITDAAPHDKPPVVHQFVVDQLTKYIAGHPADLGKDGTPRSAAAWVTFKIAADEKALWETTCGRCHTMLAANGSGLPSVAASKIPARWFGRAVFDHGAHQELTCESCHVNAKTSSSSAEVMLPGVAVCQRCHSSAASSAGAACSGCHVYHDWSKEKGVDGKIPIDRISLMLRAASWAG